MSSCHNNILREGARQMRIRFRLASLAFTLFTVGAIGQAIADYGMTITSCSIAPNPASPGQSVGLSSLAGQAKSASSGASIYVTVGFRDGSGNWVGGQPAVVWTGSGTSWQSWSGLATVSAPTATGTYYVWVRNAPANDAAGAIADFKSAVPTSANEIRDDKWGTPLTVALEGPPTLETVSDIGNSWVRLTWSNAFQTPLRFLGCAFDLYDMRWVGLGTEYGIWYPFPSSAASGDMNLGHSGGYYVWISSKYSEGWGDWHPCDTPWAGIIYSGSPHTPLGAWPEKLTSGRRDVRLHWRADIYGTWYYEIRVYKSGKGYIKTQGPSGSSSLVHYIDYPGMAYDHSKGDFFQGYADFTLPSKGTYTFYLRPLSWESVYGADATPLPSISVK